VGRGGLHVFGLTLELLGYDACNIFNADPGSLRRPFHRPLHHRLQGDARVTAPEAHQHVVSHCLCQSATLLLQAAADSLLQLGYLPPGRVKKREHNACLWCHVPVLDRAEAEGCQSSIGLAQETPDALRFTSVRCLEIIYPLLGDGQLLHLLLHQLPLLRCQSGLLVPQTGLLTIIVELMGQDLGAGVL
jgi:hypothetical protein